jgi:parvulin-like peptidyl-prolyl isomerase
MLKYLRMGNKRTKLIWWFLTVVVVGTFIGGFIFMFGMGAGGDMNARQSGAIGIVNGDRISQIEYQNALAQQQSMYRQQYGVDPADRDVRYVQVQAWRSLVTEKLLDRRARELGLKPTDREVVLSLQTNPPPELANHPDFQTNGKFDPQKYTAQLRNPNLNWSQFESAVRAQLPTRKLQERMVSSLKLSEPELRESYRDRFEQLTATVVQISPQTSGNVPPPSPADLDRIYNEYKGRFNAPARTQLEILQIPIKFRQEDVKQAMDLAQSLAERARKGEDFAALARDYSEGPGAQQGGLINRPVSAAEFGPETGPQIAELPIGGISSPALSGSRAQIFKVIERQPTGQMKVAQIIVKVRPDQTALQTQADEAQKIRDRAAQRGIGLGKAASEKGLATTLSGFYDLTNPSPALADAPEALDWGISAKVGAVSPLFHSEDAYTIVQAAAQRAAGPAPKEDVSEPLRQLAEIKARTQLSKPQAEQVKQLLAQGKTLEEAGKAAGGLVFTVQNVTRMSAQDERLRSAPELVGTAFGTPIGTVTGPIETLTGWYFVRPDKRSAPDSTSFDQLRGQLTNEILQRRQQTFFMGWIMNERQNAKIKDLRTLR